MFPSRSHNTTLNHSISQPVLKKLVYSHDTDALISKIKTETRKKETNLILVEGHLISQCPELMNEIFDAMIYIDIDEKTQWKRRFSRARDLAKQYPHREGMGMDTNYEVLSVYAFVEDRERIESEVKHRQYRKEFGKLGWLKLYFDDVLWPSTFVVCRRVVFKRHYQYIHTPHHRYGGDSKNVKRICKER